jgi:hypothetical protein
MAIQFIANPKDAADLIYHYLMDNPLAFTPDVREWVIGFLAPQMSLTYGVAETAEVIYARMSELTQEDLELGASVASCASYQKLNNFADDDGVRGEGIYQALMREAGAAPPEGGSWPLPEEDPMPKDVYLPPPPLDFKDVGKTAPFIPPPEPSPDQVGDVPVEPEVE